MEILIALLSFVSMVLLFFGIYIMMIEKRKKVLSRLKYFTNLAPHRDIIEEENREKFQLKNLLALMGKGFATRGYTRKIEEELLKAEIPMKGEEFLVLNLIFQLLAGMIGLIIIGSAASAFVLMAIVLILPWLVVQKKKVKRFEKLNQQIGEGLTVMSNALRAGYSFQQAIDLVGKEMTGPLAMEFRKTVREIHFGTPTDQALTNLMNRVESDDLGLMITAVLIQRQIGGNLAEILDNISFTIRERIRIKGEIKTLTAQGRISGLIIGLMPPILFCILMIINPTYMSILLVRKLGWLILGGGITSELIGVMLIKKVVNIKV